MIAFPPIFLMELKEMATNLLHTEYVLWYFRLIMSTFDSNVSNFITFDSFMILKFIHWIWGYLLRFEVINRALIKLTDVIYGSVGESMIIHAILESIKIATFLHISSGGESKISIPSESHEDLTPKQIAWNPASKASNIHTYFVKLCTGLTRLYKVWMLLATEPPQLTGAGLKYCTRVRVWLWFDSSLTEFVSSIFYWKLRLIAEQQKRTIAKTDGNLRKIAELIN